MHDIMHCLYRNNAGNDLIEIRIFLAVMIRFDLH